VTSQPWKQFLASRARGENPAKIARALGVSRASIYRHLAAESE
jgi:DNA-binding phage protein